jgi:homoserine O-acetyltransferase
MIHSVGKVKSLQFEFSDPKNPLTLRVGGSLDRFTLAYEVYGEMNADRSNVILLFHAMTGSQHAAGINARVAGLDGRWTNEMHLGWWDAYIGHGKPLDTRKYCVVCANYLGGCYGSTGPASIDPETKKPWGPSFPVLRICDIVDTQVRLLDHLGVKRLHAVIGASVGGYLCLSFATRYPDRVGIVIPVSTGLETTVMHRILNFEQVTAIEADPNFRGGNYYGGKRPTTGLALARRIAHKTFVSLAALEERAKGGAVSSKPPFAWYEMKHPVESYMLYQGLKFVRRFDANSYLRILDAWQWFDLVKEANGTDAVRVFRRCREQQFLIFSIESDGAFPPEEQAKMAEVLKRANVPAMRITVHSDKGHDAFLIEPKLFSPHLYQALNHGIA